MVEVLLLSMTTCFFPYFRVDVSRLDVSGLVVRGSLLFRGMSGVNSSLVFFFLSFTNIACGCFGFSCL